MEQVEKQALKIVLDFAERYNKQDQDKLVAEASQILGEYLEKNK